MHYRGVHRNQILGSILRAANFLQTLDLGPISRNIFESWQDQEACSRLVLEATDDASLSRILNETDTGHFLARFAYIFECHALCDIHDKNPKGDSLAIHRALQDWSALAYVFTPGDEDITPEIETYTNVTLAARLSLDDVNPELQKAMGFRDVLAKIINHGDLGNASIMPQIAYALIATHKKAGPQAARLLALQYPPHLRRYMTACLMGASGIIQHRPQLPRGPLDHYGIPVHYYNRQPGYRSNLESVPGLNDALQLEGELEKVIRAINALYPDEIIGPAVGTLTDDGTEAGFYFHATKRAVHAVAAAFPTHDVIDRHNKRVPSLTPPPPPAPAGP